MIVEKLAGSETSRRVMRFGIAGLLSTAFYFVVANLIVLVSTMDPAWASLGAYLLAIVFSYTVQSRFTYRVKQDSAPQIIRFLLTSGLGLAVSYWVVWICTELFSFPFWVGPFSVCIIVPVMNYFIFSLWVFSGERSPPLV
ncbi:MAG: GtrA family protein [Bauldia litoralis]